MTDGVDFVGTTAVVTGATSGIGRATARLLGRAGAHVYAVGRSEASLSALRDEFTQFGGKLSLQRVDLRPTGAVTSILHIAYAETGRLDLVMNSAGASYLETICSGRGEHWRDMFEINVLTLLESCQAAISLMKNSESKGSIVNISSIAANCETSGVYGATKAAVHTISESLREETESLGIRVLEIMPGSVMTNLARNYPSSAVMQILASSDEKTVIQPSEHLPESVIRQVQSRNVQSLLSAEDVAEAIVMALNLPRTHSISPIVIRAAARFALSL